MSPPVYDYPQGDSTRWIAQFTKENGRPPRILHVGNINNNAYQTAKMLNARGADCDVLCADYYHIMGNPEWDDADFEGEVGNQFFPALHLLDLKGFQRPRWFAQGPRHQAIAYLLARRQGQTAKADQLWNKMEKSRRYLVFKEGSALKPWLDFFEALPQKLKGLAKLPFSALADLCRSPRLFSLKMKRMTGRLDEAGLNELWALTAPGETFARIRQDAATLFPDRAMTFGPAAELLIESAAMHKALFECYDIIEAYALDPVWPYLLGMNHYVAYEHGTLRDTVYENSDLARLSLLAYARAAVIYVTNVDCYDSALYIAKPAATPIVCGLHGFDTERMLQRQEQALQQAASFDLSPYKNPDELLFFCPARVDIDPHYGTYLKANDLLYKALGRLYKERGGGFRVLQLEWGNDCEVFKGFIRDHCHGLEAAVSWHPPFGKAEYYQILQHSALVFDNLLLRLMGGNGIETMMNGHAALVNKRIPDTLMLRFFPEMWPILPIEDEDDIYLAAKKALDDPEACRQLAAKGRQWILEYHSHARIVQKNCEAYQIVLPQPPHTHLQEEEDEINKTDCSPDL